MSQALGPKKSTLAKIEFFCKLSKKKISSSRDLSSTKKEIQLVPPTSLFKYTLQLFSNGGRILKLLARILGLFLRLLCFNTIR
jgi:hypothetical protein